jgi:isopentenyldiphosphate isomerase
MDDSYEQEITPIAGLVIPIWKPPEDEDEVTAYRFCRARQCFNDITHLISAVGIEGWIPVCEEHAENPPLVIYTGGDAA